MKDALSELTRQMDDWLETAVLEPLRDASGKIIDALNHAISKVLGSTPDPLVKIIKYVDPLILDLDGNGIEITALSQGILFDANGDSIKTGTAWVGKNDGILVWDRNNNGLIDSGQELFGDETVLMNGRKAAHGFEALAELDTGGAGEAPTGTTPGEELIDGQNDGIFDARDSHFNQIKIWIDKNQDGISQADELKTLTELGIQSIAIQSERVSINYTDALMIQKSSFTRVDGSTGVAGSFILAQNNFEREFQPVALSLDAAKLTNINGSGWVRDFREAATLSPELISDYFAAKNSATFGDFKTNVSTLMLHWGNQSSYQS
ncbi:MAG: hypothetical protein RSA84_24950, partial [Acinetobacter sp.]